MGILLNQMFSCMVQNIKMKIPNNFRQNLFLKSLQRFLKCFPMNKVFLLFLLQRKILQEFCFFLYKKIYFLKGVFFKNFGIDNCYTIEASFGFFKNKKAEIIYFDAEKLLYHY